MEHDIVAMKFTPKTNQLMIVVLGLICFAIIAGMAFGSLNATGGMTAIGTIAGNLGIALKDSNTKENNTKE